MIIRLIVVDPLPAQGKSDLLVYQVPENSRELALLQDVFTKEGLEHTILASTPRAKKNGGGPV